MPDEITDITLERLISVSHKYIDMAVAILDKMGMLESRIVSGGTKIKMLFPHHKGEIWFETEDYNRAGTMIKDYFRCDKGLGSLENEFRESRSKIS